MKTTLCFLLILTFFLSACSKDSDKVDNNYGTRLNTWTFTEGSKVFSGEIMFEYAILHTARNNYNKYDLDMIGLEKTEGNLFSLNLDLVDLDFNQKTYQSGLPGYIDHNLFSYSVPVLIDDIYKSSNYDAGPVMNYTISAYDAAKDIVTITFSGQAKRENGTYVNITNGKVTAKIDRF
jgi:hypothetical protein